MDATVIIAFSFLFDVFSHLLFRFIAYGILLQSLFIFLYL